MQGGCERTQSGTSILAPQQAIRHAYEPREYTTRLNFAKVVMTVLNATTSVYSVNFSIVFAEMTLHTPLLYTWRKISQGT